MGERLAMGPVGAPWAMGQLDAPPPGGALLWLQQPTRAQCFCVPKPSFDPQRPLEVPISDVEWSRFQSSVGDSVAAFKDERPISAVLVLIPLLIVLGHFTDIVPKEEVVAEGFSPTMFAPIAIAAIWAAARYWILAENQKRDEDIRRACADLNTALGGQFSVVYRADYTGFCKPKHAKTLRAVVITPIHQTTQPAPQAVVMGQVMGVDAQPGGYGNAQPGGY